MKMNGHVYGLLLLLVAFVLVSCGEDSFLNRRDELPVDENATAKLRLKVDWTSSLGSNPSGMTVYTYGAKTGMRSEVSNDVDSMDLYRSADTYHVLVHNLSSGEFGSLDFSNVDNIDSFRVDLTPITQYTNGTWDKGVTYQREPEDLAVAVDTITVSHDMLGKDTTYVFPEKPHNVVTDLEIRIRTYGITNMKSVVGSIDGFAKGWYLGPYRPVAGEGTHLLDNWKVTVDSVGAKNGWITTTVSTFGLPWGKQTTENRDSTLNKLTLCYTLRNNTTKLYTFNVGSLFHYVSREGNEAHYSTSVTLEILMQMNANTWKEDELPQLPDVPDSSGGGGSGFNAEVDPWGDGGDINIGM